MHQSRPDSHRKFVLHCNRLRLSSMFPSTEPWKAVDKRVPLEELKSVPADSPSIECTYDIWQRRVPENRSFRKGKKKGVDENVLNYETTI